MREDAQEETAELTQRTGRHQHACIIAIMLGD